MSGPVYEIVLMRARDLRAGDVFKNGDAWTAVSKRGTDDNGHIAIHYTPLRRFSPGVYWHPDEFELVEVQRRKKR